MRRLLLTLCAAVLVTAALPAPTAAQKLTVERHTLDNGMTVLTHEDHSIPMISLYVFYRVGSRNERPGITGVSHLFEHMMFNGSAKYGPKQFDLVLENAGSGGNGYTNNDFTAYLETFPKEALAAVLDLEADRMRSLTISPKNLEQERGIVKEERRVSTDNSPSSRMFEEMMAAAFVAHPYQWPVVGWMGDLDAIKLEEAQRYFDTYYGPNNATLVLTGDFKTADVLKEVQSSFGSVAKRGAPQPVPNSEPVQQGERRVSLVYDAALPAVMLGYKTPAARHVDAPALEVLSAILSTGESSRLYRKLVYGQVATEANASFLAMADPALFTFYAQAGEKTTAAQCEAAIADVVREVKANGVTTSELQKAKNLLRAGMIDQLQTIANKANLIGAFEVQYGDWNALTGILDRYDAVTSEDIKRVAALYLNDDRKTVVTLVLPEKAKEVADAK
ncbi:MAG: insulinase family protein [Acidobacteria bacterium]|nr:insulinase family protein [Acidobacteriota bacterium]